MRWLSFVSGLLAAVPAVVSAQTVRGIVLDSASSEPITGVSMALVGPDSQVVTRQSSGTDGQFQLAAPAPGTWYLRARRVGYREREIQVSLGPSSGADITLQMAPLPVAVAPMAVIGKMDSYLETRGFYQRRSGGGGAFLDPVVVEELAPKARQAADILGHIPGVRIETAIGSGGIRVPRLRGCKTLRPEGDRATSGYPHVYLDGLHVERDVFYWLNPLEILAVEVYIGPAQVPLQYGGTDAPCGVILIWTKH